MRIIIADHHVQPLWALKTLLHEQPEFDVIGEAEDAQGLLSLAEKYHPDITLLDCELPGIYLEDLITRLHALDPSPIIIVMSSEIENSRKVLKAGADAFVSKGEESGWLLETLRKYESRVNKSESHFNSQ
jgi:two-component system, NarL family, response regulator, fimbrial Z protein, FimZ